MRNGEVVPNTTFVLKMTTYILSSVLKASSLKCWRPADKALVFSKNL